MPLEKNKYDLTFQFDSKEECEINVYICAKVKIDPITKKISLSTVPGKPTKSSFKRNSGCN